MFVFVDRITELERRGGIKAYRNFSSGEEVFRDHFPGYPIVPGSLLLESLTQVATALIEVSTEFQKKALPVLVERVKYRHRVRPGDRLSVEGRAVEWGEQTVQTDMVGRVDGELAVHAEMTLALTPIETVFADPATRALMRGYYRVLLEGADVRGFANGTEFLR